jgi:hypothetical protein
MNSLIKVILLSILVFFYLVTHAQQELPQTKEYATVFMKVYYQGNRIVYDEKGLSKSPVVTMPDGKMYFAYDVKKKFSQDEKGEFVDVGQLINSFASFGWELKTSNVLNYNAGDRSAASNLIDLNQYLQLLTFERPIQSQSQTVKN